METCLEGFLRLTFATICRNFRIFPRCSFGGNFSKASQKIFANSREAAFCFASLLLVATSQVSQASRGNVNGSRDAVPPPLLPQPPPRTILFSCSALYMRMPARTLLITPGPLCLSQAAERRL